MATGNKAVTACRGKMKEDAKQPTHSEILDRETDLIWPLEAVTCLERWAYSNVVSCAMMMIRSGVENSISSCLWSQTDTHSLQLALC